MDLDIGCIVKKKTVSYITRENLLYRNEPTTMETIWIVDALETR